jgi:hypothetical protein
MENRDGQEFDHPLLSGQRDSAATDSDSSESNRAETFLALHLQNHNRLAAFVHTLVPVWQDAEEIIQDTLMVLWRKFNEFDPSTSFFSGQRGWRSTKCSTTAARTGTANSILTTTC